MHMREYVNRLPLLDRKLSGKLAAVVIGNRGNDLA